MKNCDEFYKVQVVTCSTFKTTLLVELKGDYIKAANITQNFDGKIFCVPFLRDGNFHILVFNEHKVLEEVDMSKLAMIDSYIMPNDNLPYAMMDACFYDVKKSDEDLEKKNVEERRKNEKLFIDMFVGKTNTIITLTYCFKSSCVLGKIKTTELGMRNGCQINFPIGTFYD